MKFYLLTDAELAEIVKKADYSATVAMALELLEYRLAYGPLGCEWLDDEKLTVK